MLSALNSGRKTTEEGYRERESLGNDSARRPVRELGDAEVILIQEKNSFVKFRESNEPEKGIREVL